MAENAIFTLSADITPQLDERALEQQAQILSSHLNRILAKQINKVSINPETGNFRPFQQELEKSRSFVDRLQRSASALPKTLGNVAKAGRSGFLKLTDAVKLTQRNMVGFGGSIRDSIRDTNLFENALDGIKQSGSTLSDMSQPFQDLAAQVRSGTSVLDRAAASGNQFAQFLQPIARESAGSRDELVELNETIGAVSTSLQTVAKLMSTAAGAASGATGGIGKMDAEIGSLARTLEEIGNKLPAGTQAQKDFFATLEQAKAKGGLDDLIEGLNLERDAADKLAGPLGRLKVAFGLMSEEERKAAVITQNELNKELVRLGMGDTLNRIDSLRARFSLFGDAVLKAATTFEKFRTGLAKILPGQSPIGILVDSIADAVVYFKVLRAQGVGTMDSLAGAWNAAFQQFKNASGITAFQTKLSSALQAVKSQFVGLGLLIAQTNIGQKIFQSMGSVGAFLSKNLIRPLQSGLQTLKAEVTRLGGEIAAGLGKGIQNGKDALVKAATGIRNTVVGGVKRLFGIASAAKVMIPLGRNIVEGLVAGIKAAAGLVGKALAPLLKGVSAGFNVIKPAIQGAGLALAGFVTAAAVTGVQFNTLKQVINATLPVVLGSASAARQLLEEVNALNDSSPFARQSFLELTKVLAGFGVEAKTIPDLIDAIQQSVAATGGGEQDLLELGQAFAKIQTQGRLTSESLQSFSVRGIDVISLLGTSMKKTTGEIKDMISDGMIPAKLALDTLTVALKTKFAGATDAVSKNFPGAMDRMKAKIRDFGGILTAAFVDPEGGGALVDLLNSLASALDHINKEIMPVFRDALEGVGENLSKIGKQVADFTKSINGEAVGQFVGSLGALLPLLGALLGFMPGLLGGLPVIGSLFAGIAGPVGVTVLAVGGFLAFLPAVRSAVGDLIKTLAPAVQNFLPKLASLFGAINDAIGPFVGTLVRALGPILAQVFTLFGGVAEAIKPIIASLGRFFMALTPVIDIVKSLAMVYLKGLEGIFRTLMAVLDPIISKIADLAEELKPFAEEVARFIGELVESGAIEAFFANVVHNVEAAVDAIQPFIDSVLTIKSAIENLPGKGAIKTLTGGIIDLDNALSLPHLESAKSKFDRLVENSKRIAPEIKAIMQSETFDGVFGHLADEATKTAGEALGRIRDTTGKTPDEILEVLANKDFKGAFGKLDQASKISAAVMVDNIGEGAERVLKVLNEKDFRTQFKGLDTAGKLFQANLLLSARDIQEVFDTATKSVETLTKAIGDANDQLKQAIDKAAGIIGGMISAAKAVVTANQAVTTSQKVLTDATAKYAETTASIAQLQKDYARALEDVISPANELAVALRSLTRIQNSLRDIGRQLIALDREKVKLERELVDLAIERGKLTGEQAADDRAGLVRSEERATIAYNRAIQDQIDLENELNGANKISLNLAGLSLAEIRAKLAIARASAKASRGERDETAQEIADRRTSARLDVEDSKQGVKDSKNASLQFEIENKKAIEVIDERIVEIGERDVAIGEEKVEIEANRLDILLDETDALKDINRLRAGETTQQRLILEWDEKIRDALDAQAIDAKAIETASAGIRTAMEGAAIAQAEFAVKAAEARGDAGGILAAYKDLWALQGGELLTTNSTLRDVMGEQLSNVRLARDAASELVAQLTTANKLLGAATALQGLSSEVGQSEAIFRRIDEGGGALSPGLSLNIQQQLKDLPNALRTALGSGAIIDKVTQQPVFPSPAVIEDMIKRIMAASNLRDGIRAELNRRNWSMSGFAAAHGYAPGELIHRGMNDGQGLMRWAEFGKEAILPLTRKFDMARVVQSPQVLPAILNALPRWRMPTSTSLNDSHSVNDLSTVVRSARSSGGPANSDVYQKKAQREFASTIGEAVRVAVIEAIAESGGLSGDDIDIHVNPNASETQRAIAKEVKRQLDKRTGKW